MRVQLYRTPSGVCPVQHWLDGLKDRQGRSALYRRLGRIAAGNLGDHKFVGRGVWEMRIHVGPGYRVYYGHSGEAAVLLLCGGSKSTQAADISRALRYWSEYLERMA